VQASLLGSDPYPGGGRIVTYAGWPLYSFAGDPHAGDTNGEGLKANGGRWYLIRASGKRVKRK
jgi:hypothetical protein